ncbi:antitoxin [Streptomyces indicus]|uniref:MT0933-like antitoxin protein n=1 Tax=Streptomyces indicus TaxID=417292 RepID=A0A1G9GV17_9ACTN|nr:antitoxin [Streptomyces indicus]SDL04529.1 MT0933-like antitoxin protein [Streptomyces indicus]
MGLGDKINEMKEKFGGQAEDKANEVVKNVGDEIDEKTGGKYADKVDQAQQAATEQIDKLDGKQG